MRQLSTRDQNMTSKLTTSDQLPAFNNEQSQYHIVNYERPQNDKRKINSNEKTKGF